MAARYWVGGTNTWDATAGTKWALTSGGAGGQAVPTAADDVFFTSFSTGTCTVGVGYTPQCLTINLTGHTGVLNCNGQTVQIAGTGTVFTGTTGNTMTSGSFSITSTGSTPITVSPGAVTSANSSNFSFTGGTYSLTLTAGSYKNLTFTGSSCSVANTAISIYGNLTCSTTQTFVAGTNTWSFLASTGTVTINANGRTLDFPVTLNGASTTWQLSAALTIGSTRTLTLTGGTLAMGTFSVSTGIFNSNSPTVVRAITTSGGVFTLTGTNTSLWVIGGGLTNLTIPSGLSVSLTAAGTAGQTRTVNTGNTGSTNSISLSVTSGADAIELSSGNFQDLSFSTFTGSISSGITAFAIYGNLTLASGMTVGDSATNDISFLATTTGKTITTNGVVLSRNLIFNSTSGGWTLNSALTLGSGTPARNITLTAGSLNTNSFAVTCGTFSSSNSNTRTLTLGTSTITCNSNVSGTVIDFGTATGLTYSASSGKFTTNATVVSPGITVNCGNVSGGSTTTAIAYSHTGGGVVQYGAGSWFSTFDFSASTATVGTTTAAINVVTSLSFSASGTYTNMQVTIRGSASIAGSSKTIDSLTMNASGSTASLSSSLTVTNVFTLSAGTFGLGTNNITSRTFSSNTATTRSLTSTSGTMTLTSTLTETVFDIGITTGLTLPTNLSVTLNGAAAGTTRTINSGNSPVLSSSQAPSFSITAGTGTIAFTSSNAVFNLNFTGFSGAWSNPSMTLYGSLTLGSAMTTTSSANILTVSGTTTSINTSGVSINFPVTFSAGGTYTLSSAVTVNPASGGVILTSGTLSLSTFTLTTTTFTSASGSTRALSSSGGTVTLTGSGTTIWDTNNTTGLTLPTNLSVTANAASSVGTRTVNTGALSSTFAPSFSVTAGTDTFTFTASNVIYSLSFTGFSGTWSNVALTLYGTTLTTSSGMTVGTGSSTLTISSTSSLSITPNGKTFGFPVTFNGTATYTLLGAMVVAPTTGGTTLSSGTLALGSFSLTTTTFSSSNTSTRGITTSGGTVTLTGNSATIWDTGTTTGLSLSANISVTSNYSGAVGTRTVNTGTLGSANAPSFSITAGSDAFTFTSSNTVYSLSFAGFTGTWNNVALTIYGTGFTLGTGMTTGTGSSTVTISGSATIVSNGVSHNYPLTFNAAGGTFTLSSALTCTASSGITLTQGTLSIGTFAVTAPVFSSNNSNTRALSSSGGTLTLNYAAGGSITVFDVTTSTGWTTTSVPNILITGNNTGAFTRSIATGTLSEANSLGFNISNGSDTISVLGPVKDLIFSGSFTGTWGGSAPTAIYGSLTVLSSQATPTVSGTLTFSSNASAQVLTVNKTLSNAISFAGGIGAFYRLGAALTSGAISKSNGTFETLGFNFTAPTYSSSGGGTTLSSSTATISSGWTISGTSTVSAGTSTILFGSGTFAGNSQTYATVTFNTASATITISGANTFGTLNNTAQPLTILFPSSTTTTFTTSFGLNGTSGNSLTIASSTPGVQHTLSKSGPSTVAPNYLLLNSSNATGGAYWDAAVVRGNVDNGNNSGWIFAQTYSRSVAETATITDATSWQLRVSRSVAETATATDSGQGKTVYRSAVTETDTATDTTIGKITFTKSATETATATDTDIGRITVTKPISETATATDSDFARTAISKAIAETSTASDADSAKTVYRSYITETDTATDSIQRGLFVSKSVSETGSITDAGSGKVVFRSYIIEADTVTDTTARGLFIAKAISETGTASDSDFGRITFSKAISETGAAADLNVSRITFVSNLNETANISDFTTSITFIQKSVDESAAISDVTNKALIVNRSIIEAIVASASFLPGFTFSKSVSETTTATDSSFAVANLYKSVSETASALDLVSGQASIYALVSESSSASAVVNARMNFVSTAAEYLLSVAAPRGNLITNNYVIDLATASDASISAFLWNLIDDTETANWVIVSDVQTAGWVQINDSQTPSWQNVSTVQSPGWNSVDDSQTPGWTPIQQIP